ncbi:hypothetical protein [Paenibacillus pinistramenti]|nr:hypothetical protein [Paenibacillus pinistramenti]
MGMVPALAPAPAPASAQASAPDRLSAAGLGGMASFMPSNVRDG